MLYDDLKKANMLALKNKDQVARNILSVVINKCMLVSVEKKAKNEEMQDSDVVAVLQKSIKELTEEAETYRAANRIDTYNDLLAQKEIISKYLPQMMSEEEIRNEIARLDDKSIPAVMKHFKANFSGKCDMKLVNQIARG